MKKLKALIVLHGLVLLSAIIQSCCQEDYTITNEGSITCYNSIVTPSGTRQEKSDTVFQYFKFVVNFKQYIAAAPSASLISTCNAMSCKEVYLNKIVKESMQLTVDRDIITTSDTIPANTDILNYKILGIQYQVARGSIELNFYELFYTHTKLARGEYTFTFKGKTDDNVELEEVKKIFIER